MLMRIWSKGSSPPLLVEVQTSIATLKIIMVGFQKIRNRCTSRPSNTTLEYILEGCTLIPQGHLFYCVHCSIISNSHNLETTYIPLNRRMDNVKTVHLLDVVLLGSKKQEHLVICRQKDRTRRTTILSEVIHM